MSEQSTVIVHASVDAGRACALELPGLAAGVFLVDASKAITGRLCFEIHANGGEACGFVADITALEAGVAAGDACAQWRPQVNALVACHLELTWYRSKTLP